MLENDRTLGLQERRKGRWEKMCISEEQIKGIRQSGMKKSVLYDVEAACNDVIGY